MGTGGYRPGQVSPHSLFAQIAEGITTPKSRFISAAVKPVDANIATANRRRAVKPCQPLRLCATPTLSPQVRGCIAERACGVTVRCNRGDLPLSTLKVGNHHVIRHIRHLNCGFDRLLHQSTMVSSLGGLYGEEVRCINS